MIDLARSKFGERISSFEIIGADGPQYGLSVFEYGKDGWRGMFIFAVATVEEAKACVDTDPVIQNGEMVAEYHTWFGSAAVMQVNSIHERLIAPQPPK